MLTPSLLLFSSSTSNLPSRSLSLDDSRAYNKKWKNLLNDGKFLDRREERRKAKLIEMKKNKQKLIPGPVMRALNRQWLAPKVELWNFKGPLWLLKHDYPDRYMELLTEAADKVFAGFDLAPTSDHVVSTFPITSLLL